MTKEFKIGDRVILLYPDSLIDTKMRIRSKRKVPATVMTVFGTSLPAYQRSHRILFDAVGRLGALSEMVSAEDLEAISPCPSEDVP